MPVVKATGANSRATDMEAANLGRVESAARAVMVPWKQQEQERTSHSKALDQVEAARCAELARKATAARGAGLGA